MKSSKLNVRINFWHASAPEYACRSVLLRGARLASLNPVVVLWVPPHTGSRHWRNSTGLSRCSSKACLASFAFVVISLLQQLESGASKFQLFEMRMHMQSIDDIFIQFRTCVRAAKLAAKSRTGHGAMPAGARYASSLEDWEGQGGC